MLGGTSLESVGAAAGAATAGRVTFQGEGNGNSDTEFLHDVDRKWVRVNVPQVVGTSGGGTPMAGTTHEGINEAKAVPDSPVAAATTAPIAKTPPAMASTGGVTAPQPPESVGPAQTTALLPVKDANTDASTPPEADSASSSAQHSPKRPPSPEQPPSPPSPELPMLPAPWINNIKALKTLDVFLTRQFLEAVAPHWPSIQVCTIHWHTSIGAS